MQKQKEDNSEKDNLSQRFGDIPIEKGFKRRLRVHQGWWRMNVLNMAPGTHPKINGQNVCSTIQEGRKNNKNFLTANVIKAVEKTIADRNDESVGLLEQNRLYNNLLSSQPLCFNFFGELMADTKFGVRVLNNLWPGLRITDLKKVIFEYAPKERYTNDNSAFDVAFEVSEGKRKGLIGLECKFTDSFSTTIYDKPVYRKIYNASKSFSATYEELIKSKYNQLFRNQLIAEALIQQKKYDFVKTGLFCYQDDESAIKTARVFQQMLTNPTNFQIITYRDFIEAVQRMDINWKLREWSMMLWARYCGMILSDEVNKQLDDN